MARRSSPPPARYLTSPLQTNELRHLPRDRISERGGGGELFNKQGRLSSTVKDLFHLICGESDFILMSNFEPGFRKLQTARVRAKRHAPPLFPL